MNPRSRESPTNGYFANYNNGMLNDERNLSDDEDTSRKRSCDSNSLNFGMNREKSFLGQSSPPVNKLLMNEPRKDILVERPNGMMNGVIGRNRQDEKDRERDKVKCNKVSSSQNLVARVSPDSQTEGLAPPELDPPFTKMDVEGDEFPDYKLYVEHFIRYSVMNLPLFVGNILPFAILNRGEDIKVISTPITPNTRVYMEL